MRLSFFILPLVLAGCAQVNRLRTDISAPAPGLGPEVTALRNNLASAFVEGRVGEVGTTGCVPVKAGSSTCVMFRTDGSKEEIDAYLSSAITLTNSLCDDFFRSANAAALHRQNVRANVNDVGTLITAILGFAKAGSIATSAVASATGFGDGVLRNYDTAYLVTPDLATLQPLVQAEQDQIRRSLTSAPPQSFQTARDAALLYAKPCTYLGMKRLLNRSVQLQTVVTQQGLTAAADAAVARAPIVPAAPPAGAPPVPVPAPAPAPAPAAVAPADDALTDAASEERARVAALLDNARVQPAMRWGRSAIRDLWTAAALDEVERGGQRLWKADFLPTDVNTFCPGYGDASEEERKAFWAGLISSMAAVETTGFNPTSEMRERDGTLSIGLLQLSITDARVCSWLTDDTIRQAEPNIRCAVRIVNRDVVRDGVIASGTDRYTARGTARYWGPMRTPKKNNVAAWTAKQDYCRVG